MSVRVSQPLNREKKNGPVPCVFYDHLHLLVGHIPLFDLCLNIVTGGACRQMRKSFEKLLRPRRLGCKTLALRDQTTKLA